MTAGQKLFDTPGVTEWTVPSGITSISVVCVGGGGAGHGATGATGSGGSAGGGGALNWTNNHPVTPGETLTIAVAQGGIASNGIGTSGGDSFVYNDAGYICLAKGGNAGQPTGTTSGGLRSSGFPSNQGGTGGTGGGGTSRTVGNGGGGAGGYTGNGGNGSSGSGNGSAGSGGGGGGGGRPSQLNGGGGGGVGVLGQGSNGAGGTSTDGNQYGRGGSGGTNAEGTNAGTYGGGGGAPDDNESNAPGGDGGNGAVRIMYGDSRTFPNDAADVEVPPADPTDLFLVAGEPSEGEIKTTSVVPYSRWTEQNSTKITIWWDQDNQPVDFYEAPGNDIYLSDSSGNKIGTAEGEIAGYFQAGGWLKALDIRDTIPSEWPSTGYVTKVKPLGEPDYTKTFKVERQNLFNPEYQDCMVLVNIGSQSYNCLIKDLGAKNAPDRIMLVNQGDVSYQTSVTDVLESSTPPVPQPYMDFNANTFSNGSSTWTDSSGNGRNMTFASSPEYVGSSPQAACRFVPNDWGFVYNQPTLPTRTTYCYEAWIKCNTGSAPNPICQWTNNTTSSNPNTYDLMFYHTYATNIVSGLYNGSARTIKTATNSIYNTQFNHIVTFYDGNKIKIYLNGALNLESDSLLGTTQTGLRCFRVGGTKTNGWPNGASGTPNCGRFDLQRLRVWIGEYLSEAQIASAYQEFLSMQ